MNICLCPVFVHAHVCMFMTAGFIAYVYIVFTGAIRQVFVEQFPALSGRTVCLHDPVFIVCALSL